MFDVTIKDINFDTSITCVNLCVLCGGCVFVQQYLCFYQVQYCRFKKLRLSFDRPLMCMCACLCVNTVSHVTSGGYIQDLELATL